MTLQKYSEQKEQEASEAELNRLKDDLRIQKARAEAADKARHEAERIREGVFGLVDRGAEPPTWLLESSAADDSNVHVPVLVTSDFQLGEVISAENMDGINEYNIEIAQRRYRTLVEKTIDIAQRHLPKNKYDGMIYLRLGDAVSGDIHDELRETNAEGGLQAVRTLVTMEQWGLGHLADAFGRVHVVSAPGNHGRVSRKPPTKSVAETNLDTLSAWWLESAFSGDERLTFQTPNSTDAVFDVHGRKYLATHGDNIGARGGQGFIGPAATVLRGFKKTHDEYARRGTPLQAIICGHFHTALDVGLGWCNGSLAGYSEFARSNRMTPEAPQQWLLFFHPRYAVTSQWRLVLS